MLNRALLKRQRRLADAVGVLPQSGSGVRFHAGRMRRAVVGKGLAVLRAAPCAAGVGGNDVPPPVP